MKLKIGSAAVCLFICGLSGFATNLTSFAQQPGKSVAKVVPLFSVKTKRQPATVENTKQALITRVADRVRDRHARESMFHVYDHYLPLYWQKRTVAIEIIDRVAKGGDSVIYNITSLAPLNKPNVRAFFEGKFTVAQYSMNLICKEIDPLHYTVTLKFNSNERRAIKRGDRIEIEFSPFLKQPVTGRANYYGTAILYVVGQAGIVPWEGRGPRKDSFPLPRIAWSGGRTTLHEQYSDEPKSRFKQMATNIAPVNAQPFMLGRRLHHTDFGTGVHSEGGNPDYKEQTGKLGPRFTERSCVACHVNNGRALPPRVGRTLRRYLVRIASDAKGTPHPQLGATLQPQSTKGAAEGGAVIRDWTLTTGKYSDGTPFSLRKPNYRFSKVAPQFFSARIASQLVGQGLLEAIPESDIADNAKSKDPNITGRMHLVADPQTGQTRLGRFGWKAGQASLKYQIAGALNNDMGVTTSIYPNLDRGSEQAKAKTERELATADLDNMYRYVATLGVPPRRMFNDKQVKRGSALFVTAKCAKCHTTTWKTSAFHPLAELRGQTIHPYTDLLLHDMGPGLADNLGEGNASGAEWRTPPLWGIGLTSGVSEGEAYLHDGRARNLSEAILWHAGEAKASKETFRNMPPTERTALIKFLQSL